MKEKWIVINKSSPKNALYLSSIVNNTWDKDRQKAFIFSDKRIANKIAMKNNAYAYEIKIENYSKIIVIAWEV